MSDNELVEDLKEKISNIEERLKAIEKEQRMIREDILSGREKERMQQRLLENTQKRSEELKKKFNALWVPPSSEQAGGNGGHRRAATDRPATVTFAAPEG